MEKHNLISVACILPAYSYLTALVNALPQLDFRGLYILPAYSYLTALVNALPTTCAPRTTICAIYFAYKTGIERINIKYNINIPAGNWNINVEILTSIQR